MSRFGVHAGRLSGCRLSVVSIAVLAMLSPLGVVSSAQAASPPVVAPSTAAAVASPSQGVSASSRIRITPATGRVAGTFTMKGTLPNVKSRSVRIQRKIGTRWMTTTIRTRTTRTGAYIFKLRVTAAGSYTLRVWAPRARVGNTIRASYVTPARTLRAR